MTSYLNLLHQAITDLTDDTDPDGCAARQAILLATRAGTARVGPTDHTYADVDWDLYTVAIVDATQRLQADLAEPVLLAPDLPTPDADDPRLRQLVIELVRLLADRYAGAAEDPGRPAWRRLVWASVAHRLDDARTELE